MTNATKTASAVQPERKFKKKKPAAHDLDPVL